MQNVKKAVFVVLTIVLLLFSYTAYFGVQTTYGDATTDYVKGVDKITWGGEGQGYTVVVLQPELDIAQTNSATTAATESDLYDAENIETFGDDASATDTSSETVTSGENVYEEVRNTLEKRMAALGVPDSQITYSLVPGTANGDYHLYSIKIPNKETDSSFASTVATVLQAQGSIEISRKPATVTETTDATTESEVLFTRDDIYNATLAQSSSGGYILKIQLNNAATKRFRDISKEMVETGDTLSVSLDGTSLLSTTLTNEVKDGVISVSSTSATSAVQNAAIIDSGELPWALVQYDEVILPPTITVQGLETAQMACGIAIAVLAICMIFIFRLSGITAIITLLSEAALMLAFVTGYYPDGNGIILTKAGIVGAATAIAMGAICTAITAAKFQKIASEKNGMTKNGISQAISSSRRYGLTINIALVLVAVILMGVFGPATNSFSFIRILFFWAQNAYISVIYLFAQTLLYGACLNLLLQVLMYPIMLWSLTQFESLKKSVLWGGSRS